MEAAAIYCRVSTDEQRKHGISLDAQASRCEYYVKTLGLEVIHTGIEALSAKDTNRPELQKILALAVKKRIAHLVMVKADRLSRDVEDGSRMGKMFAKKGIIIHLTTEGGAYDLNDPVQEMMFNMRFTLGRFERRRISLNTKFGMAKKRELGQRISGRAQFGYKFEGSNVVADPHEQNIIARIRELHESGYSLRAIQKKLTGEGLFNRHSKPIGVTQICRILDTLKRAA